MVSKSAHHYQIQILQGIAKIKVFPAGSQKASVDIWGFLIEHIVGSKIASLALH